MEMNGKNLYLEIITDENKAMYIDVQGKTKNHEKYIDTVTSITQRIGDKVIREDYRYILNYRIEATNEFKTAFINDFGMVSTSDFGFNAIPVECLDDAEKVKLLFKEPCKRLNIALVIQDIKIWKSKTNE